MELYVQTNFFLSQHIHIRIQADALIVASYSQLDMRRHCFKCHPYWTGHLDSYNDTRSRMSTTMHHFNFVE